MSQIEKLAFQNAQLFILPPLGTIATVGATLRGPTGKKNNNSTKPLEGVGFYQETQVLQIQFLFCGLPVGLVKSVRIMPFDFRRLSCTS
ncbi:MAG: hypothetical protein L3J66_12335 [Bacteroidales bacterium]|nr:hypothetical protein [Bacteroidales bacterium]